MWQKKAFTRSRYANGLTGSLLEADATRAGDLLKPYQGTAAVVYLDPPRPTRTTAAYQVKLGSDGYLPGGPQIALPAFNGFPENPEAYSAALEPLLTAGIDLLSPSGTLFVHLDQRIHAYVKIRLDKLMGEAGFMNEIIWERGTGAPAARHFNRRHDVIYLYRKSAGAYFDITRAPVTRNPRRRHMRRETDADGNTVYMNRSGGKTYAYPADTPAYPNDIWTDVSMLSHKDPQRTGFPLQKPLALLERIIRTASRPGDLIADLCCGSGTTLLCAALEGRRFLGVDVSPHAVSATAKRLYGFGFYQERAADTGQAMPRATVSHAIGLYSVTLEDFPFPALPAALPAGYSPRPLDAVDQWAAGFIQGGVFMALDVSARTKNTPSLRHTLDIPMLPGPIALEITDIGSRRHLYVYQET